MASGSPVPSASSARPRPLPSARPGSLLTAAAAVPLGTAVLYASGWLAWGPRLALGIAVVVLGNAVRATVGTVTGARIGGAVAGGVGLASMVGGLLLVVGAALTALGMERAPAGAGTPGEVTIDGWMLLVAVPTVGVIVGALTALVSRGASAVRTAQEAAAVFAFVALFGVLVLADQVALSLAVDATGPAVEGGSALGAVGLLVALLLGTTLLAATAARRPSRSVAGGAVVGTVGVALWAATLSVATAEGLDAVGDDQGAATWLRPLDLLLGFGDPGRLLHDADPAWPVLFGVVGLVLVGAAAWLESRRPVPADAPLGRAARD